MIPFVIYGLVMYRISVWRTHRELDARSTELADAKLRRLTDRMAAALEAEKTRAIALDRDLAVAHARAGRLEDAEDELRDLRHELTKSVESRARLRSELETERREHDARVDELRRLEGEVEKKFAALASQALGRNAESFLGLVSERFAQHKQSADEDLARRQKAIEGLIAPIRENLGKFETAVGEIEKARNDAYGAIRTQVEALAQGQAQLSSETGRLVQALRAPKTRGRWGEFQLRQVFEMAGMMEKVDFLLERSFDTDDGRQRPDALVRLPGGKSVVIDAKTPLDAYLTALEATDPAAQAQALADHARQLKAQVKLLGGKDYWAALPEAPDFVVMFVPGEAFYSAAMEQDPTIFETALDAKVLVCSPTTLIALVKSIAYGWQQEKLAENAEKVARDARTLYERLAKFGEHMDGVGRGLRQAVSRYNDAVGSLETRVMPSARGFRDSGVVGEGVELSAPRQVELEPRRLNAPELTPEDAPAPLDGPDPAPTPPRPQPPSPAVPASQPQAQAQAQATPEAPRD